MQSILDSHFSFGFTRRFVTALFIEWKREKVRAASSTTLERRGTTPA
jgi:hypothetical protein